MLRVMISTAGLACLIGCTISGAGAQPSPWADAGATFEPTIVVRETEVYAGYRSDCARRPDEVGLSDACVAVQDRWFGVERLSCGGRCDRTNISLLGLDAWLGEARKGFTRVEVPVVVSSGVVSNAAVASVVRNLMQASDVAHVRVGEPDDVWWAAAR